MKINILKEKFAKGLSIVEKITGKNLILPILDNVLIKAETNKLKLSTTDLEIGINYWCQAQVEEEGEISIPVKRLSALVSLLEEEKINIETKEKILLIKGENQKAQIKGLDTKDFPIIPEVSSNTWFDVDIHTLIDSIVQVMDFCAITQIRPELSGLYFSFQDKELKIASTDSFRLAEKTIFLNQTSSKPDVPTPFILPKSAAREIINVFSGLEGKIKAYISSSQIMIENISEQNNQPQARLVSRLIEGDYPNYKEVIPNEFKTSIDLSKEPFINQIKTASLFSNQTNEIKLTINSKNQKMTIFSQNTDLGESKSILSIKAKGEEVEVSFNYRFLMEGLSKLKGDGVTLELNGSGGPGLLRASEDNSYLYILMPIKPN